jgi:hypothetical protein
VHDPPETVLIQRFAVGLAPHALVLAETDADADRFAAASNASTDSVYDVPQLNPVNE